MEQRISDITAGTRFHLESTIFKVISVKEASPDDLLLCREMSSDREFYFSRYQLELCSSGLTIEGAPK